MSYTRLRDAKRSLIKRLGLPLSRITAKSLAKRLISAYPNLPQKPNEPAAVYVVRVNNAVRSQPRKYDQPVYVDGINAASSEFLATWAWRKLRYAALRKYGAACMCCGATRERGAVIHVDHIKPRRLYPELALELTNLQILCGDCNAGKGNWDETDWRPAEKADDEILDMEALADLRERGLVN